MEFLSAVYDSDELAGLVPPVTDLLQKYHLDSAIAFDIARPKLRLAMRVRVNASVSDEGLYLTSCVAAASRREGDYSRSRTEEKAGSSRQAGEGARSDPTESRDCRRRRRQRVEARRAESGLGGSICPARRRDGGCQARASGNARECSTRCRQRRCATGCSTGRSHNDAFACASRCVVQSVFFGKGICAVQKNARSQTRR